MEKDSSSPEEAVKVDHSLRESLQMFATPNALEGEQNLIGFDEDWEYGKEDADGMHGDNETGFQKGDTRPAGWSDYQSAWLDAIDLDVVGEESSHPPPRNQGKESNTQVLVLE